MMSLRQATKHVALRNPGLGRSYAEISRFVRTRYHGITLRTAAPRCLSTTRMLRSDTQGEPIILDEKLRKTLDGYKELLNERPWAKQEYGDALAPPFNKGLNSYPCNRKVELYGYLVTRRDVHKSLSFAILRNSKQNMAIQLISTGKDEGSPEAKAHARLRTLSDWTPVLIQGVMRQKPRPKEGGNSPKKDSVELAVDREIAISYILPLNEIPSDVIVKEETVYGPEHRHLQLRVDDKIRRNIVMRHRLTQKARSFLADERHWTEVETPLLFKSTPEGAREFLVPTRNKGLAYALPQSPQQYKQILMASGITRYYQFARCFRDEDLRADRQPEFTQLDLEMAWAGEEQVMSEVEGLLKHICLKENLYKYAAKYPRLTYQQAMTLYGSDKPDLRFDAKIHAITQFLPADLLSKISSLPVPAVDSLKLTLTDDPATNRKFIADFFDSPEGAPYLSNPHGQPAIFVGDASQPLSGLGPLGHEAVMALPEAAETTHGDVLILQARPDTPFQGAGSTVLGNLRTALYKAALAKELIDPPETKFAFVWITDFPLFTPSTLATAEDPGQGGAAGLTSTHHPFTAPKTAADVDLLLTDPLRAVAAHYDIVCNGVELGGGSRRIHNADVQEFVFRNVLGMKKERIEDFRHLLDVLRSGCPPHAGLALGWDRLCAVLANVESVRDVIAFPKSGRGEDVLVGAPNRVTEEQWETYHLNVKD